MRALEPAVSLQSYLEGVKQAGLRSESRQVYLCYRKSLEFEVLGAYLQLTWWLWKPERSER